ncbi:MAG TPA: hypothetical protein VD902_12005 [Symbiobacteriaceae bacterium]|nr:hypothetical protein [Symbiobacteriaceae bacterium]
MKISTMIKAVGAAVVGLTLLTLAALGWANAAVSLREAAKDRLAESST